MTFGPGGKAGALLATLAVLLSAPAGCARRETTVTTYTLAHPQTRTWVGVRVESVLKLWGEPAERSSDGDGGMVLTYRTKSSVSVSASVDAQGKPRERNLPGSGYPDVPDQKVEKEIPRAPSAVFYVSPKGVVYRYTISPELLASGKAPEAPPPEEGQQP